MNHPSTMKQIFILIITGLFTLTAFAQKTVSIESLLKEMVDRNVLAKYPDPVFTCRQFSSYDRRTVAKGEPGWFANEDASRFLRVDKNNGRTEFVMMDAQGPGAIVRFWMTFFGDGGTLRIYIDDDAKPAIEGPAVAILGRTIVTGEPLAKSVPNDQSFYGGKGHNLYFPVPYAKRCKVTFEGGGLIEDDVITPDVKREGKMPIYYNINYRAYDPATVKVIAYSAQEMKKNQSLIDKVQKQLNEKERGIEKMKLSRLSLDTTLKSGESKSFTIKGMNAIQQLSMELKAANQHQALRSTVLEIAFDGEKTVWTPVGDFYGTGYMPLYTSTWYTCVEKDGLMSAFWVMPFEKECMLTLHNLGEQDVTVTNASLSYTPWKWDSRSMHFGATWQQYTRIDAGPHDLALDLNFANLKGILLFDVAIGQQVT